jgi:hypothetical protein
MSKVASLGRAVRDGYGLKCPVFENQLGQPRLPLNGYRGACTAVKRPPIEFDPRLSSTAEVKNEWSFVSITPTCVNGVDRDNFNASLNARTNTATEGYIICKAADCTLGLMRSLHILSPTLSRFWIQTDE